MIDSQHPRAASLKIRDQLVWGVEQGITSTHGLIAQGRGEAFDYLIAEKTHDFAKKAIEISAALLLRANYPVLSVNGNSVVLAAEEYIKLAELLDCPIEINLFHRTLEREKAIQKYLKKVGAKKIVGVGDDASVEIKGIASKRKFVSPQGIDKADVVFVPLEDGDRTEALIKAGKKVITIDLNPLSRTAQKATITIIDNIIRAMPNLITKIKEYKEKDKKTLKTISDKYDNKKILLEAITKIRNSDVFLENNHLI
jgi:4-phosphopantoate--beta-alanine ligase